MMRSSLAALVCLGISAAVGLPRGSAAGVDGPIVVTQLPAGGMGFGRQGVPTTFPRNDYGAGGRLVIVNPDGSKRRLAESLHSVCDPAVSFDGRRLLMAGKKSAQDVWNVYEVGVDGSGLRQITRGLGDCRSPS